MTDGNECHRSPLAYPVLVKAPSSDVPIAVRQAQGEEGVDWRFIACSGATTANVERGGDVQNGEPATQLDQGALTAETDLVTITIGGNDAGFADVLDLCFRHACMSPTYRPYDPDQTYKEWLEAELDALWDELNATFSEIREASPDAAVAVLGYPRLFPSSPEEQNCFKLNPWDGEQNDLNDLGDQLDDVIAREAAAVGAVFLPVAPHFATHEVCGNGGEWINGPAAEPAINFPPIDAKDLAFHPNRDGQREYAALVNGLLVASGSVPESEMTSAERGATDNPGSLGDLDMRPLNAVTSPCPARVDNAISDSFHVSGNGFRPGAPVRVQLVGPANQVAILDEMAADDRGSFKLRLDLPAQLEGKYLLEAIGTGTDNATRILVDGIELRVGCDEQGSTRQSGIERGIDLGTTLAKSRQELYGEVTSRHRLAS